MGLTYQGVRGGEKGVAASMAISQDLIKDGGLFMPSCIPQLNISPEKLASMTYQETAYEVMKLFLTDYTERELKGCIARAYDSEFDAEEVTPLAKADGACYLELYHGGAIAFKDMALSILPHLMTTTARKNHVDQEIVILTATSGDTGETTMAGFADVPGTRIIVFYPKDGVSKVQELQIRTQEGDNTSMVAIHGNFDDARTGMKKMFGDKDLGAELMGKGFQFSSASSISIGRLVPRIIYYVYTYAKLLEVGEIEKGENINVAVPIGNFGNILAAYFAKHMGLPVETLVCTSNDNKVLYDFFTTGIYNRRRKFTLTNSPSMDILISSNLGRLIYMNVGYDALAGGDLIRGLSQKGRYEITSEVHAFMSDFVGGFATQKRNTATIKKLFGDTGYLIGTHTGVAASVYGNYRKESGNGTKTVIASTASPHKFSHSIMEAIAGREGPEGKDELEVVDTSSALSGVVVPQAAREIRHAAIRHNRGCGVDDMENEAKDILGIN